MGDYSVSDIYQGGYSSFKPNYGDSFVNYKMGASKIGASTDPRTANIMQDASTKLNMGVKQIELSLVSPEVFDSIPKQHLKEINRMSKLVGAEISVHGPVLNSTGISEQGFSELNRENVERRISDVLIRSHEINPEGNSPVTFHAGEGIPGTEWKTLGSEGKEREAKKIIAVDIETGKMIPLEEEKRYYPGAADLSKPKIDSPERNLEIANDTEWDNKISQLFFNKERADEILQQNQIQIQHLDLPMIGERVRNGEEINSVLRTMTPTQQQAYIKLMDAQNYLKDTNMHATTIFSKAYKFGDAEQKEELKKISDEYRDDLNEAGGDLSRQSQAMHKLLLKMQNMKAPEMFVPIEEFATKQSSMTFGNAEFEAYKKFGNTAPILSIENPPAGFGMATGEDLKNLVVASREQFAKRAVKEKGLSENEAKKLAEKFIGATWDVGHINMLRKQGFGEEDIVKESEKIAPFVKHVHLSDNFGFEHTELPMGMGNVPIKKIMEKLGQEGFDAKKIIEAGQWWQHFQTPPFKETLEAFGSPIYSMQMAPYWNQSIGLQQGYFGGYGAMLPSINYESFGAGFSRLPAELGGQRDGEGSRMSGRGME